MKGRLQEGGLALITHSDFKENIGRCVTLGKFVGDYFGEGIDYWAIYADDIMTNNGVFNRSAHQEKYLMPLGDEESKKQFEKEKELENA